jgi:catechol 2,3-dioxygenase-like lactoylglutathione lyase family enzyme
MIVPSLADAADFWRRAAGCVEAARGDIELDGARLSFRLMSIRNAFLLLIEQAGAEESRDDAANEPGLRHLCVQARDGVTLADRFSNARAHLFGNPLDLGTGNSYVYAHDAYGNIVEIEGLPYAPEDEAPWLAHASFVAEDIERLPAFYAKLLGKTDIRRGAFGPDRKFDALANLQGVSLEGAWISAGNLDLEFWRYVSPGASRRARALTDDGYAWIAFEVADDVAATRLAGAAPISLAKAAFGEFCFYADPEDNVFVLINPAPSFRLSDCPAPDIKARVAARRRPTSA